MDFDSLDTCVRWPTIAPAYDALNRRAWPFEDRLHAAVVEIAHPTLDTADARSLVGVVTEIHPLHAPIDQNVRSHPLHRRSPPSPILVCCACWLVSIIAESGFSDKR
jgi:hypothetical protein